MVLNKKFPYNPNYRLHILIGVILGALLSFILISLKPFNLNNFNNPYSGILLIGFGFSECINYILAYLISNYFFLKRRSWLVWDEIIFICISSISGAIIGYIYLDIVFEEQPISISRFLLFVYHLFLPVLPLIVFTKTVVRYLFSAKSNIGKEHSVGDKTKNSSNTLLIKGDYLKDELVILEDQLLYVKSEDNYVIVYYKDEILSQKMLRSKLSNILNQAPFLVQTHRSYLVNSNLSFKIKGNSQKAVLISKFFKEEIPVSRASYKTMKVLFG
ncbi:LytTR family transcriptional regulator [Cellulophaga baltica]|uniref:LytTR family DNA-binding domain-containing protein n=1 Tax=Cellulophaga TaxID=104264 RepID=UPI001C066075|nr:MULTISPECIES: LytTR family DNA-binding domain-containing protein [Cellulophaga]MBU2996177.1 LytTR family transcriptional regulator [Cellulophaga baltica]MDO6767572.1 LytTR family DNA-binding domain-containing protein [Cellulophaga sp. 1_MG-2023]